MAKVSITQTEVLAKGHTILEKVTYDIVQSDGSTQSQTREVLSHANAATCLLYNKKTRSVLLTRQFRIASFLNGNTTGMLLETPAGLLEEGEEPAAAMIREIKEETGYEVAGIEKVCEGYSSPGAYTELLHLYVAEYSKGDKVEAGGGLKEEGEDIALIEMPFDEALQQVTSGAIRDLKTILLLQFAAWKGLL
jgi:nudix-type nucleoside diphosphatase (YffH/AdpP family)